MAANADGSKPGRRKSKETMAEEAMVQQQATLAFAKFDSDNSGRIDANELHNALAEAGYELSEKQIKFVLRKYREGGESGDGVTLGLDEFTDVVRDARSSMLQSVLNERLDLRTHPHVQAALDAWWGAAMRGAPAAGGGAGRRGSTGRRPSMAQGMHVSKQQYGQILKRVFKAMLAEYDEEAVVASVEAEARADCRGKDFMDADMLKDGIFELADRYARLPQTPDRRTAAPLHRSTAAHRTLDRYTAARLLTERRSAAPLRTHAPKLGVTRCSWCPSISGEECTSRGTPTLVVRSRSESPVTESRARQTAAFCSRCSTSLPTA